MTQTILGGLRDCLAILARAAANRLGANRYEAEKCRQLGTTSERRDLPLNGSGTVSGMDDSVDVANTGTVRADSKSHPVANTSNGSLHAYSTTVHCGCPRMRRLYPHLRNSVSDTH